MYDKAEYEQMKLNHECYECGKKDARTLSGKILCQSCADRKIRTQAYRNRIRKHQHKCISCGKQDANTLAGHIRCSVCAEKNRINFQRWKERKKA